MPQPTTTAQKPPEAASTRREPETAGERQIARAEHLERENARLLKAVDANRKYLRLMDENDELTKAESAWLRDFYPQKAKGDKRSDDELDATRKVREAARKGEGYSQDFPL